MCVEKGSKDVFDKKIMLRFGQNGKTGNYRLDPISLFLIGFQILTSVMYATIGVNSSNPQATTIATFMLALTFGGLLLRWAFEMRIPLRDIFVTPQDVGKVGVFSIIGFAIIAVLQTAVIKAYTLQAIVKNSLVYAGPVWLQILLANVSIGEETFFRYSLQPIIEKSLMFLPFPFIRSKTMVTISTWIIVSIVFVLYHIPYTGQPAALMAVFVSSLVLCAVHSLAGRLSSPMLTHILVNVT